MHSIQSFICFIVEILNIIIRCQFVHCFMNSNNNVDANKEDFFATIKSQKQLYCHSMLIDLNVDNILHAYAMCNITDSNQIIQFSHRRIENLFNNGESSFVLHDEDQYTFWSNLIERINEAHDSRLSIYRKHNSNVSSTASIHIHNLMKLGDLLELIHREYLHFGPDPLASKEQSLTEQQFKWVLERNKHHFPFVMTNWGHEYWGFLSGPIGTRTTRWLNMSNHLRLHHIDYNNVRTFLDSDDLNLLVTNAHVDLGIGNHSKIICLPVGIKARDLQFLYMHSIKILMNSINHVGNQYNKTRILYINNSGGGDRKSINKIVSGNFNYSISNSYVRRSKELIDDPNKGSTIQRKLRFYQAVLESKFLLCPSGQGFDTSRIWESLLLGTIPIVESNPGLDRTYSDLPVLIVSNFSQVTPQLLNIAYKCFISHAHLFNYQQLSENYWLDMIKITIESGQQRGSNLYRHHPFRNKYCDFIDF